MADLKRANLRRKWSVIPKQQHFQSAVTFHRVAAFCFARSRFFEVVRVVVRFDHVARFIVNALFLIETVLSR
jgi:hypothetical protein